MRFAIPSLALDLFWRLQPRAERRLSLLDQQVDQEDGPDHHESVLRSLIQRFPYWPKGRAALAQISLGRDDVATAYKEAQALRALTRNDSTLHAVSLTILGCCHLKRGDAVTAIELLNQALAITPKDYRIHEELAAALIATGEREQALTTLNTIPPQRLSAEGKAALGWLKISQ